MKQFGKILKFELKNYFADKSFILLTVFFVAAIAAVMFFPRVSELFAENKSDKPGELPAMLVASAVGDKTELIEEGLRSAFPDYNVVFVDDGTDEIEHKIINEQAQCAFIIDSPVSYRYLVNNLSVYDEKTAAVDAVLQSTYTLSAMMNAGLSAQQARNVMSVEISHETKTLGKDRRQNFFYTYIMIFALYMVILLYGQMVATNVATEKSSRAMELLITSARPVSMMFGKVLATCTAGFLQLAAVFGTALVSFRLNKKFWIDNNMVTSIFDMPVELLVYMLIFFVLGFLIYAFMYSAIGSTVSRLEDMGTAVMPVTLIFIASFFVVMFSMTSDSIDSLLMKICSFIPFTSPMAMFTRLALSTVPAWETALSVTILVAAAVGTGILSAKIYRIGVLLYGNKPAPAAIVRAITKAGSTFRARQNKK